VERVDSFPTTANGKPDHAALASTPGCWCLRPACRPRRPPTAASVRDLLAVVVARPDATVDDSFVSLAGDSLSFVEASTRLAEHLGTLPQDWHRRSARDLAAAARPPRRRGWVPTEVPSLLRALAILAVVVTHCDLVLVPGGAHVLLAVAGYNLSRFALAGSTGRARVGRVLGSLAAIVVPAAVWIAGVAAVTGQYRWSTALLLNQVVGPEQWTDDWQFWFIEALALAFLLVAGLMAVPAVARLHDRAPFGFAGGRGDGHARAPVPAGRRRGRATERYAAPVVLWCIALGWWATTATSASRRVLVAAVAAVSMHGFFDDPQREAVVTLGIALLVFVPQVPLPRFTAHAVRLVSAASFWIYVTHWQVYPPLEDSGHPGPRWWRRCWWARRLGGLHAAAVVRPGAVATWGRSFPNSCPGTARRSANPVSFPSKCEETTRAGVDDPGPNTAAPVNPHPRARTSGEGALLRVPGRRITHADALDRGSRRPGLGGRPPLALARRHEGRGHRRQCSGSTWVAGVVIAVMLVRWQHWVPPFLAAGFGFTP
jgi:hypothetical protein